MKNRLVLLGWTAVLVVNTAYPANVKTAPTNTAEATGTSEQCEQKNSTVEIVECLSAETRNWDTRLNNAYQALLKQIEPARKQPLTLAERDWIQFRNANCKFYGSAQGTISSIDAAECMQSMTQARARELEQAAKSADGGK
jgi:uncharacterized protein YecT (DUF1311 family)